MAINPVIIEFMARGMPDVSRAFRGVQQIVTQSERQTLRSVVASTRSKEREYQKLASSAERWQRAQVRTAEKAVRDEERAVVRAAQEKTRTEERAAREKVRIISRTDAEVRRIQERATRDVERDEARRSRAAERSAAAWLRTAERRQREVQAQRRQFTSAIGGAASQGFRAGASRVFDQARATGGLITQLGGGFSVADAVQRSAANAGQLEDILNSAANPASAIAANKKRREASTVAPAIQASAVQFGMERSEVQQGLGSFTGITGDFETAMKLLPQLAELTRATGSNFDELSQAAGNVGNAFGDMTDSGKKAEKIMEVMRTLAGQGKAGNVEIRDQAVQASKVVAAAGKFEGGNADNITKLGAIMQAARGGGGAWNAASAATAVTAFTSTFGKGARRDAFKAEGINIEGAGGKVRSPEEIIADSIQKTGGDITRMNKLFGSVMSDRAVAKYVGTFRTAESTKKGSGRQAVLDEITSMTKGVAMSRTDVTDAAKRRVGALDARMASARARFDQAVEERLVPALLELVPVVEKMVPVFVDLHAQALPAFVDLIKTIADFASKNKELIHDIAAHPIGTIMAAEVTKSIAAAAIGEGVKGLLLRMIGGGGGAGAGGAGGGGVGGALAAGAMAGAATYALARPGVDAALAGQVSGQAKTGELMSMLKRGSPAEQAQALQEIDKMQSRYGGARGAFELATGAGASVVGSAYSAVTGEKNEGAAALSNATQAREVLANEELKALVAALKENSNAVRGGGTAGGHPSQISQPITNRATK